MIHDIIPACAIGEADRYDISFLVDEDLGGGIAFLLDGGRIAIVAISEGNGEMAEECNHGEAEEKAEVFHNLIEVFPARYQMALSRQSLFRGYLISTIRQEMPWTCPVAGVGAERS